MQHGACIIRRRACAVVHTDSIAIPIGSTPAAIEVMLADAGEEGTGSLRLQLGAWMGHVALAANAWQAQGTPVAATCPRR